MGIGPPKTKVLQSRTSPGFRRFSRTEQMQVVKETLIVQGLYPRSSRGWVKGHFGCAGKHIWDEVINQHPILPSLLLEF